MKNRTIPAVFVKIAKIEKNKAVKNQSLKSVLLKRNKEYKTQQDSRKSNVSR